MNATESETRLEAILYGREVASDTTESNPITVEEFDPVNVREIPATWWDHFKLDISTWIYHRSLYGWRRWRDALENINVWLRHRIVMVPAPQSHKPRTIVQSICNRKVTAVCPHIGAQTNIDRHLQFVSFGLRGSCVDFRVAPLDGDELRTYHEESMAWREHCFRHALLALCVEVGRNSGHDSFDKFCGLAREIKDLFDRYGVGA